jgi:hypothetical protein
LLVVTGSQQDQAGGKTKCGKTHDWLSEEGQVAKHTANPWLGLGLQGAGCDLKVQPYFRPHRADKTNDHVVLGVTGGVDAVHALSADTAIADQMVSGKDDATAKKNGNTGRYAGAPGS